MQRPGIATALALGALVLITADATNWAAMSQKGCAGLQEADLLASRARAAIGSASRKVVSFSARGLVQPTTSDPEAIEVAAILPDKYISISRSAARETTYFNGFSGDIPFGGVRGRTSTAPPRGAPSREAFETVRTALSNRLVGWFLLPLPGERLNLRYGGEKAYRGRQAILLSVIDSPRLLRSVWLDPATCMPLGILYERREGMRPEPDPGASGKGLVRMEEALFDRRPTSGFLVPYREEHYASTGRLTGRWTFDRIEVNARLDPGLFRPPDKHKP